MLSSDWNRRKATYDYAVIGSGYGGAITAARIAAAALNPKPAICILERGKEWPVGSFPDDLPGVLGAARSDLNPLGLFELLTYRDISVIKGSGLGGTSLINANVAIVPDREIFEKAQWPASIGYDRLQPFYGRARTALAAGPHPRAASLAKVQALDKRARQFGGQAKALDITVNFESFPGGRNPHGAAQPPCNDCGDCVTGCNFGSKNTLYMNYLPMAKQAGAEIFTQVKVEWLEKLAGGGWRIHGVFVTSLFEKQPFKMDCRNVILAAGAINSTEILLRSEMHGLAVSPALGTGFSGNGDFFGLSYNGDAATNVLGYGQKTARPGDAVPPGPSIVGMVRYNGSLPEDKRITVEDFSFPSAYVLGAKAAFGALVGQDTVAGSESAQRQRWQQDLNAFEPYARDGALNHTMMYLVMGQDNAKGSMTWEAPWNERDGRMKIEWDGVGRQAVFTRINEELRRHARALGANFISNPTWNIFNLRHLITAHPLGGCPVGEDYLHGAVDPYGRVFSKDGSIHDGLLVADGSLIPSALGVNPFLTISALAEHIAEKKIRVEQGAETYPAPPVAVSVPALDPEEAIANGEGTLDRIFRRTDSLPIRTMLNSGGAPEIDVPGGRIRNDRYWKGFFPKGSALNAMSSLIFTSFRKAFSEKSGKVIGVTSDTDGRIQARNSLEEVEITRRDGALEPGRYILLKYLDDPWRGFFDLFKVVNENLLIGRVYLGEFPTGTRLFTFPMTRQYGFDEMTTADHEELYSGGAVPQAADLQGVWRMDVVSNANHSSAVAYLKFDSKPDGRIETRYQLLGLLDGLVIPRAVQDHFELTDFTPFHDEIRVVDRDLLVGKYITDVPEGLDFLAGAGSLGILHSEEGPAGTRFGFYYMLTRAATSEMPGNRLLAPLLDVRLPDGLGMTFDETMEGWYFEGVTTPSMDRAGDLTIGNRVPADGTPEGASPCSFTVRMGIRDVNEFVDGYEHEAQLEGSIRFGQLSGMAEVTCVVDPSASRFHYLRVNPATGEAEMNYHLEFASADGRRFALDGRKYMQRDTPVGQRDLNEVLNDYTTLYCHVYEGGSHIGTGYLKFRTFEDVAATANLAGFLASFQVTGTDDPFLRLQAQLRFLAFTGQFVQAEYDPLAPEFGVRAQAAGGGV